MRSRLVAAWSARVTHAVSTLGPFLPLAGGSWHSTFIGPITKTAAWPIVIAAGATVSRVVAGAPEAAGRALFARGPALA